MRSKARKMSSATIDSFAACQPDLLLRLDLVKTFSFQGETLLGKVKSSSKKTGVSKLLSKT